MTEIFTDLGIIIKHKTE